jgi:hypothetical protein
VVAVGQLGERRAYMKSDSSTEKQAEFARRKEEAGKKEKKISMRQQRPQVFQFALNTEL